MSTRVAYVKKELKRPMLLKIQQQTKGALQSWANDLLRRKITPVTPVDTGLLRRESDIAVGLRGESIEVIYFNKAPYAAVVEAAWFGRASPKTPGTIAPFAEPTIREEIRKTIADPIRKGFTL